MRHKNDIALAATSARSYNRHWRAKKLSWADIGKIKYLFDGAYEYMDDVTLAYRKEQFNELRKALGFKQDSELTALIERSEAFRIVRNKETKKIEAFMSPFVGDRYVLTDSQEIEEPAIPYELFDCKANALANNNDRDKISENQRHHQKGINMKMLLAGNVPQFHVKPSEEAYKRIHDGLMKILGDDWLREKYYGEFLYAYMKKYKVDYIVAYEILSTYIDEKLARHMACRVGIENWPSEAITKWVQNYFSAKKLPFVITEADQVHNRYIEKLMNRQDPIFADPV
jgi:hypothetical protein